MIKWNGTPVATCPASCPSFLFPKLDATWYTCPIGYYQWFLDKLINALFLVSLIGFVIMFGIPTMCAIQVVFAFASTNAAQSGSIPEVGEAVGLPLAQFYKKGETTATGTLLAHWITETGESLIKNNANSHVVFHHLASGAPSSNMMACPTVGVLDTSCPYLPITLPHIFESFKYKWKEYGPHRRLYPQPTDCRQESNKQLQQSRIQHSRYVLVLYGEFMGYKFCSVCFRLFFLCLDFGRKGSNKTKQGLACCEQLRMNSL